MTVRIVAPIAFLSIALSVVAGARQAPQTVREVDAMTFLLGFRAGTASTYNGFRVIGVASDFHGVQTPGGGANMHQASALATPQPYAILTVGGVRPNAAPVLLKTWEEWRAADRDATTLDVLVRLPNPPAAAERKYPPSTYEFSGMYSGEQMSVARLTPGAKADASGCGAHGSMHTDGHGLIPDYKQQSHCVPVLTDSTIK